MYIKYESFKLLRALCGHLVTNSANIDRHCLFNHFAFNHCKQFGLGSGPTKHWTWPGYKLFDMDGIP